MIKPGKYSLTPKNYTENYRTCTAQKIALLSVTQCPGQIIPYDIGFLTWLAQFYTMSAGIAVQKDWPGRLLRSWKWETSQGSSLAIIAWYVW